MTTEHNRSLALPVAIVVGSLIIGVCLYLGLREGSRSPSVVAPAADPPAAQVQAPPTAQVQAPAVEPTPGPSIYERAQQQAQAALDSAQPGLSMRCWTPPSADEPAAIALDYEVTFAADGAITMLAISEQRAAYRTRVADCVRGQPRPALPIEAPGEPVQVHLVLQLP